MEQSSVRLNDANSFLASSMVTYIAISFRFLILFYFSLLSTFHLPIPAFLIFVAFLNLLELPVFSFQANWRNVENTGSVTGLHAARPHTADMASEFLIYRAQPISYHSLLAIPYLALYSNFRYCSYHVFFAQKRCNEGMKWGSCSPVCPYVSSAQSTVATGTGALF